MISRSNLAMFIKNLLVYVRKYRDLTLTLAPKLLNQKLITLNGCSSFGLARLEPQ